MLIKLVGELKDWTPLDAFLLKYIPDPALRISILASSFATSLEMVREGVLEVKQEKAFSPLLVKTAAQQPENINLV